MASVKVFKTIENSYVLPLLVVLLITIGERSGGGDGCGGANADTMQSVADGDRPYTDYDLVENFNRKFGGNEERHDGSSTTPETQVTCILDHDGRRVCNCGYRDEPMILPKMGGNTVQVIVHSCRSIRIAANTFDMLIDLNRVTITNVDDLKLEAHSFAFSRRIDGAKIILDLKNVVIEELSSHAISGNLDQLIMTNCRIGLIRPFCIGGFRESAYKLEMRDTSITQIDPQAFKKLTFDQIDLVNTTFITDLPSRAFYEIEIREMMRITNCHFQGLQSSAFLFNAVATFVVTLNHFKRINGEAFRMQIKQAIILQNNTFNMISNNAFRAITIHPSYYSSNSMPMDLTLHTNYVDISDNDQSLYFAPEFHLKIQQMFFIRPLTCDNVDSMKMKQFLIDHSDQLYFRMSDHLEVNNDGDALIIAHDGRSKTDYLNWSYILNQKCIAESYLLYIIIGIVIIIIVFVAILISLIYCHLQRKRARRLNIVMPEVKTYRETQIVMQIENHGLLKTDL